MFSAATDAQFGSDSEKSTPVPNGGFVAKAKVDSEPDQGRHRNHRLISTSTDQVVDPSYGISKRDRSWPPF